MTTAVGSVWYRPCYQSGVMLRGVTKNSTPHLWYAADAMHGLQFNLRESLRPSIVYYVCRYHR